MKKQLWSNN